MSGYKRLTEKRKTPLVMSQWGGTSQELKIYNRLAEIEDKIDNGTLIEMPCKVGDKIYICYGVSVEEWEVVSIQIYGYDILFRLGHKGTDDYNSQYLRELGEIWFPTKAEAEKKLEELRKKQ